MLAGIVPSTNSIYSGGVENFLRTAGELVSSSTLWYNGSIVVMFPSQYATNYWQQTGNYYNAPNRNWAFDTNFVAASRAAAAHTAIQGRHPRQLDCLLALPVKNSASLCPFLRISCARESCHPARQRTHSD